MMAAILGFMPALDRRRNIAIKSGTAAKVVPKPAIMPTISDRCNLGTRRLDVSCGVSSPQPLSGIMLRRRTASNSQLNRLMSDSITHRMFSCDASRANCHGLQVVADPAVENKCSHSRNLFILVQHV